MPESEDKGLPTVITIAASATTKRVMRIVRAGSGRSENSFRTRQTTENKKELNILIKENQRLKKEMEAVLDKELHKQQVELLTQRNRISEEKLAELKDLERKLKSLVIK